jgi:hypothetical protein
MSYILRPHLRSLLTFKFLFFFYCIEACSAITVHRARNNLCRCCYYICCLRSFPSSAAPARCLKPKNARQKLHLLNLRRHPKSNLMCSTSIASSSPNMFLIRFRLLNNHSAQINAIRTIRFNSASTCCYILERRSAYIQLEESHYLERYFKQDKLYPLSMLACNHKQRLSRSLKKHCL